MAMNASIFATPIGLLKLLTVLIGVVDLGLTANKYLKDSREEYFLAMVIILFAASTILIILAFLGVIEENDVMIKVDFAYHVIGGFLLLIGAVVWFVSITHYGKWVWCNGRRCNGPYTQRVFAGIIGMINSVLYLGIGALIFRTGSVV